MIDLIIVFSYLAATLVVGFLKGRYIKDFGEYSIAKRSYPTVIMVATIFATIVGGGTTTGVAENTFKIGVLYLGMECISFFLNSMLMAHVVAPRVARYTEMLSVGDIMERYYGRQGRMVSGFAAAMVSMGIVSIQVYAIGHMISYFTGVTEFWGIIIGCGVVIGYSSFGGVQSVVATDVLQFAIFVVMLPLIASVGIQHLGGYEQLFQKVPTEHFSLFSNTDRGLIGYICLLIAYTTSFPPALIQRMLMSRDARQAKKSLQITAWISIPFILIMGLNGFIALAMDPSIDASDALPHLVNAIVPAGFKGLVVAGILAAIMSTADSDLNIAGISVVQDLVKPLLGKRKMSTKAELNIARLSTFILGASTVFVAMSFKNIIDIVIHAYSYWAPTVLVPLVAAVLGFKVVKQAFIPSVLAGAGTVWLWEKFLGEPYGVDGLVPAMLANAIVFTLICWRANRTHN